MLGTYRRRCEELQCDVVRISTGEPRPVRGVDDTAVGDTESVEPDLPSLELCPTATGKGEVVQPRPAVH